MARVICFESEDGKKLFRFEVKDAETWVSIIDQCINIESSQETLRKIITKSSDEILVDAALCNYRGNLTYKFLVTIFERFEKEGKDLTCGVVQYCVINKKKLFLKKFRESENERLSKFACEVLTYMS